MPKAGPSEPKKRKQAASQVIVIPDSSSPPPARPLKRKRRIAQEPAPTRVQHLEHAFPASDTPLPRRNVFNPFDSIPAFFWTGKLPSVPDDVHDTVEAAPDALVHQQTTSQPTIWPAHYAPTCSEQVLGAANKANALYLKEWMSALALKASHEESKARKVVRRVDPKKAKRRKQADSDLDDFIVSDEDEVDYDQLDSPPRRAQSETAATPCIEFNPLTNLILLQGPHASGKTSTVYALANELGWQVHEVNPGSTKRSCKDLLAAVGEVGKNHTMTKRDKSAKTPGGPLASIFKAQAGKAQTKGAPVTKAAKKPEQSVILIEEVDVLFTSDKSEESFWDGIFQIVASSLRPVILTCTDASRIPKERLALQNVLHFEPPSEDDALPLLQTVAAASQSAIQPADLAALLQSRALRADPSSWAARPPSSLGVDSPSPTRDLRFALLQLQFWRKRIRRSSKPTEAGSFAPPTPSVATFHDACQAAQLRSAADLIDRTPKGHLQAEEDQPVPRLQDQELGFTYLDLHPGLPSPGGIPAFLWDEAIARTLHEGALPSLAHPPDEQQLAADRHVFLADGLALSALLPPDAPLPLDPAFVADYIPYISSIVRADDAHAAQQRAMQAVPVVEDGRNGRRSRRLNSGFIDEYERHLRMEDKMLAAVRRLMLNE